MDQLYMLRAFVAAARYRSFTKAGEALGVSAGTISKAVAKLEGSIKTRLLHRTTQSVSLAEGAKDYYPICCRLLDELDEANRQIMRMGEADSRALRLAVHPMLVNMTFLRLISDYHSVEPNVNLVVSTHCGSLDLHEGQFDAAILPDHPVDQSSVICHPLLTSPYIFVASQDYLERYDAPTVASELTHHFLLLDTELRPRETDFFNLMVDGQCVTVFPQSFMEGDKAMLRAAALAGVGIAIVPEVVVREDLAAGDLTQVLRKCVAESGGAEFCLYYLNRELLPARVQAFVDHCVAFFSSLREKSVRHQTIHIGDF